MEGNQRHDFEVILLGDAGVGKTTLFIYLQTGKYVDDDARLTLGVDITYKSIKYEGKDIVFKVNDTGGNERFRTLTGGFYRRAQIVLLMYSMEDQYTLQSLPDWITECIEQNEAPNNLLWVLVGNKMDLENEVQPSALESFCHEHNIKHLHFICAKSGEKVEEMLQAIIKAALNRTSKESSTSMSTSQSPTIKVGSTATKNSGSSDKCKC